MVFSFVGALLLDAKPSPFGFRYDAAAVTLGNLVALVGGLAFAFWPDRKPKARTAMGISEARAERRDIKETVEAAGFVRAVTFSTIRAQVSGPILKLNVQTGDMVKKDQILVELDPVLANADEEQARRTLQLQILTLERLERDLRRVEVLVKEGFVSEREVLDHRTAYDVAKLQRDIAGLRRMAQFAAPCKRRAQQPVDLGQHHRSFGRIERMLGGRFEVAGLERREGRCRVGLGKPRRMRDRARRMGARRLPPTEPRVQFRKRPRQVRTGARGSFEVVEACDGLRAPSERRERRHRERSMLV